MRAETPYAALGGAAGVRRLVDTFYDQMDRDPAYAQLRRVHRPELTSARDKLTLFLSGWLGGPNLYIERYGHPRLRARHLPFAIGTVERDQWMTCMGGALTACAVTEPLLSKLLEAFYQTADFMRNQPG
jgi:hemoglobin